MLLVQSCSQPPFALSHSLMSMTQENILRSLLFYCACTPTQFQLVQIIYIMLCTSLMSLHFLLSTARAQSMYKLLPTKISNLNHYQASASVHKLSLYIGWQVVYCHAIMTYLIRNVWCYIASRKPHVKWFIAQ